MLAFLGVSWLGLSGRFVGHSEYDFTLDMIMIFQDEVKLVN